MRYHRKDGSRDYEKEKEMLDRVRKAGEHLEKVRREKEMKDFHDYSDPSPHCTCADHFCEPIIEKLADVVRKLQYRYSDRPDHYGEFCRGCGAKNGEECRKGCYIGEALSEVS